MKFPYCLRPSWFVLLALAALSSHPAAWGAEAAGGAAAPATEAKADAVGNSVVKVFASVRYPDVFRPWAKQSPSEVTGSGVVIEGKRILSNAHVVLYASQVQIQANQAGDKLAATVESISPGMDLAVLKLDDESFFDTHPPLARAPRLPEIRESVLAYGFPTGGSSLSITKGIVSRIEFAPYHFPVSGLWIQIDAAINPGNSGGPVVSGDKMIGLAFSRLGSADNIGYIIPCEEIDLFLQDVKDGRYDGKPALFDDLQTLENPALRSFLKLDKNVTGIVVTEPFRKDADYPLRTWDLITRIGDTPIDNDGSITLSPNLRVRFRYLVQKIARDGQLPLTIVRDGKTMEVKMPVSAHHPLVMAPLQGRYPSYFVYGPLVFSSVTQEFLSGLGHGEDRNPIGMLMTRGSQLVRRAMDRPDFDGEELVAVPAPFFPHKLAKGYSNPAGSIVRAVNGKRVKSLNHLVEMLRDMTDEYVSFELDLRGAETPVFRRAELVAATEEILSDNGVRSQGSPDTMAIWNAKGK